MFSFFPPHSTHTKQTNGKCCRLTSKVPPTEICNKQKAKEEREAYNKNVYKICQQTLNTCQYQLKLFVVKYVLFCLPSNHPICYCCCCGFYFLVHFPILFAYVSRVFCTTKTCSQPPHKLSPASLTSRESRGLTYPRRFKEFCVIHTSLTNICIKRSVALLNSLTLALAYCSPQSNICCSHNLNDFKRLFFKRDKCIAYIFAIIIFLILFLPKIINFFQAKISSQYSNKQT